ncbi:hypothetical protein [Streptomyces sp. NPDC007088]|uniref:hypothetical protein n=1 Tax=Streptomyces sp. NPDC007088 TaxID=3364773 RepID=UPI00368396AA
MDTASTGAVKGWEAAVLDGGPADGLRMRVADRPGVVQVTLPCPVDEEPGEAGLRVEALYVYRRDPRVREEPLRYGFDGATP